jgi:4-amino-4-deoxy-L-arabinose transferase-like glycosyltransferase
MSLSSSRRVRPATTDGRDRYVVLTIAAVALTIALATRLPRVLTTPGWDGDEGYTLEIAWNLAHGDARMFALEYRFVAHPPLAFAIMAPALHAFGRDLGVARTVAGVASALTVALVAWGLARTGLRRAAVLGGLALAITPFAVAYGRMAYTYVVLALVVAATLALLVPWRLAANSSPRRTTTGGLSAIIGLASLGPLVDHPGLALAVLVAIEVRLATRSWLASAGAMALSLAPAVGFHAAVAWLDPVGSAEEWQQVAARLGALSDVGAEGAGAPRRTLATTIALLLANVPGVMRAAWWMPLAVAGLLAIPANAGRATTVRAFILVAIPALAIRPVDTWFRSAIPLLPIVGWGLGAMLDRGVGAAFDLVGAVPGRGPLGPRLLGACFVALVLLPLGLEAGATAVALFPGVAKTLLATPNRAGGGNQSPPVPAPFAPTLSLPIDPWLTSDHDDARAAAAWVNARVVPTDLVIASPAVTWLITARVADHLQATAHALPGSPVAFYPAVIAPTRWRFNPSLARARYAILDRVTDAWITADPSTRRVLGPVTDRAPAFRAGNYRVVPGGS